jgi:hypothetical protein
MVFIINVRILKYTIGPKITENKAIKEYSDIV